MDRASPQMRDLAGRLIAHETKAIKPSDANLPAAFFVCEKLRPHLATLMGSTGFHALLSRALAVANADDPWLRTVHVKADGSLSGLGAGETPVDSEAMAEGSVVLVAQLLGLLVAFVGDNLTLRMVRDVWPKLSLKDLNFTQGDHP